MNKKDKHKNNPPTSGYTEGSAHTNIEGNKDGSKVFRAGKVPYIQNQITPLRSQGDNNTRFNEIKKGQK